MTGPDTTADDAALALSMEVAGHTQVVHVTGRIDTTTADRFDARLQQAAAPGTTHMVLDITRVTYVSSAGLRSLLTLLKRVKAQGGRLVLAGASHRVVEILDIAGFTDMFTMTATPDEALAQLQTAR